MPGPRNRCAKTRRAVRTIERDGPAPKDRHDRRSTLIASQLPIDRWHDYIGEATLADAILDRLLHGAHRLNLTGESTRKECAAVTACSVNCSR